MRATAKELRFNSKKLLDVVSRGEEVIITYRGKPCAKLTPLMKGDSDISQKRSDALFGIWKDHDDSKDVAKYVRKLRKGRFDAG
jgi:prevent-host-death family protein